MRLPIPYVSNTPWKKTTLFDSKHHPKPGTTDTSNGCVAIYALTDLSAPETVSQGIQLLVSHSGGEDFEVARPLNQLCPGYGTTPTSEAFAEGDIGEVVIPDREDTMIPDAVERSVAAQTTGEYFKSLRAFIKRSSPVCVLNRTIGSMVGLKPHLMMEGTSGNRIMRSAADTAGHVMVTPFYMASFLFRFWNGSTIVKAPGIAYDHYSIASLTVDSEFTNATNPADPTKSGIVHLQRQSNSGVAEYRIPFYQDVRCGVVGAKADNPQGSPRLNIAMRYYYNGDAGFWYESGGDDFNYFFLIGPPPMKSIDLMPPRTSVPIPKTVNEDVKLDFSTLLDYAPNMDE